MNENFKNLKSKIKDNAPEICAVIGATAGVAALVMAVKLPNVPLPLDFQLNLPKSTIKHMIETGDALKFDTPKLKLLVYLTDM